MFKTWRRRWISLAVLSACLGVAAWAGWQYAESYARREVESQLRRISDAPLEISSVQLGLGRIVARDIRFLHESTRSPWLHIERLVADIRVWDVIQGNTTPQAVLIRGGSLALELDAVGNLVTPLSRSLADGRLPNTTIRFENTAFTIGQPGSNPLTATQIEGRLRLSAGYVEASARIGDALGSAWTLEAKSGDTTHARIATPLLRLTGSQLSQLPSVPKAVANLEQISAAVNVDIELPASPDGDPTPAIDIRLSSLEAQAPRAALSVDGGTARIVIAERTVRLEQLTGGFAGGSLSLAGEFQRAENTGSIRGSVTDLALSDLPDTWRLPPRIRGVVTGATKLDIVVLENDVIVSGTVRGTVDRAQVAGLAVDPIEIGVNLERRSLHEPAVGTMRVGLGVANLDLHDLLAALDRTADDLQHLPRGRLSGKIELAAPLDALRDPLQYRGSGRLELAEISVRDLTIRSIASDLLIADGQVSLKRASCQFADGKMDGQIVAEMATGSVAGDIALESLSVAALASNLGEALPRDSGNLDGNVSVSGSWTTLAELDTWTVKGKLRSDEVTLEDETLTDLAATVLLEDGELQLDGVRAAWNETRLAGRLQLSLESPLPFSAEMKLQAIDIADALERVDQPRGLPSVTGTAALEAALTGTLAPLTWRANGNAEVKAATVASRAIDRGTLQWSLDRSRLTITRADVNTHGGSIQASGVVPFDERPIEAQGTFQDIACDSVLDLSDTPFKVFGLLAGDFSFTKPQSDEPAKARVGFRGPTLEVRSISTSELAGTASLDGSDLEVKVQGKGLNGELSVDGAGTLGSDPKTIQFGGRVRADNVDLAQLAKLSPNREIQRFKGTGSADLTFEISGPTYQPTGNGTLSIERLGWRDIQLATTMRVGFSLTKDALLIPEFAGRMHEGRVNGSLRMPLAAQSGGTFRLNLDRVRTRRLLAFWPRLSGTADGDLDVRVEGRFDRQWYGSGQVAMSRTNVAGIPIQRLRAPIHWVFAPESNRVQLNARDVTAHIGRGRMTTDVQMTIARRLDLKCRGKMEAVDIRLLLKKAPGAKRSIDGAITADFSLEGRDVRSANDLTGTYAARIIQSQALMLPVLHDLASSLGVGAMTRKFDVTESRGRLTKGGIIHVDDMHLGNSDVQMDIQGRMWLSGRLDLDVTAHVGEFAATSMLGQLVRSPLRLIQPVGVGLILRAGDFLQRRLLFLKLSGTIRNPVVRPRANEFLSQEAILFFIDQASVQLLR